MSTLVCQLPTRSSGEAKSRFTRTLLPDYMRNDICGSQKGAVTEAVVTSVKALTGAAECTGIPASIKVESSPIPNGGHGSRLSIILDMPTPAWDKTTFDQLHNRLNGNWESLDFDGFSRAWMGKRFLPVAN